MSLYAERGVSSSKEEVHAAIMGLDKGLFPNAFCKIMPDLAGDPEFCFVQHVDTAGTKPSAAYLYYRETGDSSVFKDIVKDAIVMNTDDVACAGFIQNLKLSSVIGRNPFHIDGEALKSLIEGQIEFITSMAECGIAIQHTGGETADVPDIVRTLDVGATVTARMPQKDVIDIDIIPGMDIIGFASFGKAIYESKENSGISANGITNARHSLLAPYYKALTESYAPEVPENLQYIGTYKLTDTPTILGGMTVGEALLSPTRTYLPVIKEVLEAIPRHMIGGFIHCTGGGQTKVKNFLPDGVQAAKHMLFPIPPIFELIQATGATIPWKEMYENFNMGHRLEAYVRPEVSDEIIDISNSMGVAAQRIGFTRRGNKSVWVQCANGDFVY